MEKFEAGKTYTDRSTYDHEFIAYFEIIKRTAKTIVYDEYSISPSYGRVYHNRAKRAAIRAWDGEEVASWDLGTIRASKGAGQ